MVLLKIKTLRENSVTEIEIDENATIADLQEKIAEKLNVPKESQ
eukprot:gene18333-5841_t